MSASILLSDLVLLDPEAIAPAPGSLWLEGGKIRAVIPAGEPLPEGVEIAPLGGARVAPGLIDLHLHGRAIFVEPSELLDALRHDSIECARHGATAFLTTTVSRSSAALAPLLTRFGEIMTQRDWPGAVPLGLHLEGPWINREAAGAQPDASIHVFDFESDARLLDAAGEWLRMVTLAPELPGSQRLIELLRERGAIAALGHSLADGDRIDAAKGWGMTHVTHLFNAMGVMHHREPGTAGWVLGDSRLSADLICDGVHVHPRVIALAARALAERLVLITDRIDPPLSGSDFGSGGLAEDGQALRTADGRLAGSTLSLNAALGNARKFGALGELEAVAAASLRPARVLGLEAERGSLRVGARADLAIFSEEGELRETWIAGRCVYRHEDT